MAVKMALKHSQYKEDEKPVRWPGSCILVLTLMNRCVIFRFSQHSKYYLDRTSAQ